METFAVKKFDWLTFPLWTVELEKHVFRWDFSRCWLRNHSAVQTVCVWNQNTSQFHFLVLTHTSLPLLLFWCLITVRRRRPSPWCWSDAAVHGGSAWSLLAPLTDSWLAAGSELLNISLQSVWMLIFLDPPRIFSCHVNGFPNAPLQITVVLMGPPTLDCCFASCSS